MEALTTSNIMIAREIALSCGYSPQFTVIGFRDSHAGAPHCADKSMKHYSVDLKSLFRFGGLNKVIREQDAILDIGLGDSFTSIYGPKRFCFLWTSKAIAIAANKPLLLSPQTIGPFDGQPYRALAAFALNRASSVIARDEPSLKAARDLAPDANVHLAVDVAFELPYEDRTSQRGSSGRLRIGVNVSGLLFREAESDRNRFGLSYDYAKYTRSLLKTLSERPDVDLFIVPHVIDRANEEDDDAKLADRLAVEFPQAIRPPDFSSASEAKSFISSLDFLVAARMHACIAAFSSGTNVLPVCYSRKFVGLFGTLGYNHLLPVKGINLDEALSRTEAAIRDSAILGRDREIAMTKVNAALAAYRVELAAFFRASGNSAVN